MKYFIDTEYVFTAGPGGGFIDPLSIGVVAEDGREFYEVSLPMFSRDTALLPTFVSDHVLPVISYDNDPLSTAYIVPLECIANDLKFFIGSDAPEFWGDYADFDYVVLSTIMGGFEQWPDGWPMYINDFQQIGVETLPSAVPHNALADARALRDTYVKNVEGM